MEIDIQSLRQELLDYYGTAWASGIPAAIMELSEIETASPERLIEIGQSAGLL